MKRVLLKLSGEALMGNHESGIDFHILAKLADQIITIAFGLTLGSVAVAVAIAFGLGAKDIAAGEVERWLKNIRGARK